MGNKELSIREYAQQIVDQQFTEFCNFWKTAIFTLVGIDVIIALLKWHL
jgi:hypothetical protein